MSAARAAWTGFHWGRKPRRVSSVRTPERPAHLVELGRLESVTYGTRKGKQTANWEHAFGEGGRRKPILAMDRNRRLHIVGGGYDVEDRGIVG